MSIRTQLDRSNNIASLILSKFYSGIQILLNVDKSKYLVGMHDSKNYDKAAPHSASFVISSSGRQEKQYLLHRSLNDPKGTMDINISHCFTLCIIHYCIRYSLNVFECLQRRNNSPNLEFLHTIVLYNDVQHEQDNTYRMIVKDSATVSYQFNTMIQRCYY